MKTCKEMTELMSLYIDKELSSQELEEFRKHIDNCDDCKKELESLEEIVLLANNLEDVDLPENYHQEVIVKLKKENRNKFKGYKKYALASCMFLIFVSLFWSNYNFNSNNSSDFNIGISNSNYMGEDDLELGSPIQMFNMRSEIIETEEMQNKGIIPSPVQMFNIGSEIIEAEEMQNKDIMQPMIQYISYDIHLEVEDVEETYHVINQFPGNMISLNVDYTDGIVAYLHKIVDINDYEHIKIMLSSLGNIVFEQERGLEGIYNDMQSELRYIDDEDVVIYINVTLRGLN